MEVKYKLRLLRLAEHLLKGKLAHKVFDFRVFNESDKKNLKADQCGTNGCALGECPAIWKSWRWNKNSVRFGLLNSRDSASSFFGLATTEVAYLFYPKLYDFDGTLPLNASKERVASHILAFVASK